MNQPSSGDIDRDAKLSAFYRAADEDLPSSSLDAAVLAAAHRAAPTRPRLAGAPFGRSWRVTLSMAAVLVLSVSLVMLMREQASEKVQPQGADFSRHAEKPAPGAAVPSAPASVTLADSHESSSLGLKPSLSSSPSGLGLRSSTEPAVSGKLRLESTPADRTIPAPASPSSTPEGFPGASVARESGIAVPAEPAGRTVRGEARRDMAANAERPQAPAIAQAPPVSKALSKLEVGNSVRESDLRQAPGVASTAAKPVTPGALAAAAPDSPRDRKAETVAETVRAHAELPPDQWLAGIELLGKQGRLEEARASLAEFRRRYPSHPLPAYLSNGIP